MRSPSLFYSGNFVIYISSEGFILQLNLNYICVDIDMFVNTVTVFYWYVFKYYNGVCIVMCVYVIQSNWRLYFVLVFCSIATVRMGFSTTALLLHICLY